jgi:hypothetical protein
MVKAIEANRILYGLQGGGIVPPAHPRPNSTQFKKEIIWNWAQSRPKITCSGELPPEPLYL